MLSPSEIILSLREVVKRRLRHRDAHRVGIGAPHDR
jgi:hypothetical protein